MTINYQDYESLDDEEDRRTNQNLKLKILNKSKRGQEQSDRFQKRKLLI